MTTFSQRQIDENYATAEFLLSNGRRNRSNGTAALARADNLDAEGDAKEATKVRRAALATIAMANRHIADACYLTTMTALGISAADAELLCELGTAE